MKSKEEILKMSKEELCSLKWSEEIKETFSDCYACYDCYACSGCYACYACYACSDCSYCYDCRMIKKSSKYMICNVQLTKEEYEKKMEELLTNK